MKRYKDYINLNESKQNDFIVDQSMVVDGRFKEGIIPKIVKGVFRCNGLGLTTLEGGPEYVGTYFNCENNNLTSLEFSPVVDGNFNCSNNKIINLEYVKEGKVKNFYCKDNQITSLKGMPEKIDGTFHCHNNKLTSLEHCAKYVKEGFVTMGNRNNLFIERDFIKSNSYKNDYYTDLLNYMIKQDISFDQITTWPEGFITDNIERSSTYIRGFNL